MLLTCDLYLQWCSQQVQGGLLQELLPGQEQVPGQCAWQPLQALGMLDSEQTDRNQVLQNTSILSGNVLHLLVRLFLQCTTRPLLHLC